VLIDGRRVPHTGQSAPGGAGGREDFNVDGIPLSAIERIEVLPQGAGAIYGSEAIAGVINIVLKKNYQGAELNISYDNTFDSDAALTTVSLTGGYRADKLSSFITISQSDQNALAARDRWFTAHGTSLDYNPYAGPGTFSTDYFPAFSTTNLPGLAKPVAGVPAGTNGNFTVAQADAAAIGQPFDDADYSNLIDASRSRSVVWKADYAFLPWLQPYIQVRWSDFKNTYDGSPITLNQYLPQGYPGNPFAGDVYLSKVFYDLPRPHVDSQQVNTGLNLGATGQLWRDWRYDAGFAWARNVAEDDSRNTGWDYTKLGAATSSATPPNFSYDSSTVTDPSGTIAGLLASSYHKDTTDVTQFSVTADGTVWAGWAGDIKAAVGVETQEEKAKFFVSPAISYLLSDPFSRRTNAAFAEVSVPLLSQKQHIPLVYKLEVGGAIRYEDLSDLGSHRTP
jgi:outer membrane receptor protein involved in Fe transport